MNYNYIINYKVFINGLNINLINYSLGNEPFFVFSGHGGVYNGNGAKTNGTETTLWVVASSLGPG